MDLYLLVKGIIDDRAKTGRREKDAMQVLIDEGDGVNDIVQVRQRQGLNWILVY